MCGDHKARTFPRGGRCQEPVDIRVVSRIRAQRPADCVALDRSASPWAEWSSITLILEDEDIRCRKVNGREVASSQVFLPKGCWIHHSTATRNGIPYIIFFLQQCSRSNDTPIHPDLLLSFLTPGIKAGFAVPSGEVPTATPVGVYGDRKCRRTWLCGV